VPESGLRIGSNYLFGLGVSIGRKPVAPERARQGPAGPIAAANVKG
jgi:hypothetical protein